MPETESFITVGKLGRTRGLDGEMYITPLTDFPDRFLGLKEIFVDNQGTWEKIAIASSRIVSGKPVVRLAEVNSPEDASRYTNRLLAVHRTQVQKLPPDSYYIFDLIGCTMIQESSGEELGTVVDVYQYPANDAYVVRTADGKDVLFPAVKQYVKRVDIEAGQILVDDGGLFDDKATTDKK